MGNLKKKERLREAFGVLNSRDNGLVLLHNKEANAQNLYQNFIFMMEQ